KFLGRINRNTGLLWPASNWQLRLRWAALPPERSQMAHEGRRHLSFPREKRIIEVMPKRTTLPSIKPLPPKNPPAVISRLSRSRPVKSRSNGWLGRQEQSAAEHNF